MPQAPDTYNQLNAIQRGFQRYECDPSNYSNHDNRIFALGKFDIQLVKLKPGISADPIHCTVRPDKFSINLHYQALSYTLGKATDDFKRILVDDKPVQIGVHLLEALKSLRQPSGPERHLWIDSLCINQADDQE